MSYAICKALRHKRDRKPNMTPLAILGVVIALALALGCAIEQWWFAVDPWVLVAILIVLVDNAFGD